MNPFDGTATKHRTSAVVVTAVFKSGSKEGRERRKRREKDQDSAKLCDLFRCSSPNAKPLFLPSDLVAATSQMCAHRRRRRRRRRCVSLFVCLYFLLVVSFLFLAFPALSVLLYFSFKMISSFSLSRDLSPTPCVLLCFAFEDVEEEN